MAIATKSILKFFEEAKYWDVTFKVKCNNSWSSFHAQKLILSIWSPVFANKFQQNKNAFDDEIEIFDILPSTFHVFLNYLHGSATELEESKSDVKFVLRVYDVARKYQVERLQTHCCEFLNSSSPNINNVFELLDAAILINSNCLKGRCVKVLQSETEVILISQDIESVTPSMVITLLQLPTLWLTSENELLTWIFKWAKSYCSLHTALNPKEFISTFLPYLNFTALNSNDFAILVSTHREFFEEVECFNIFMNINLPESTELPNWYSDSQSFRSYTKPIENTESAMLGDGAPELPYFINNTTGSNLDDSNYNKSSAVLEAESSISSPTVEEAIGNDTESIFDNSSINHSMSTSICYPTLTVDKETMTDILMASINEVTVLPIDTLLKSTGGRTDNVIMNAKNNMVTSSNDLSVPHKIETSNDYLSLVEMIERGQENVPVLETIDAEPGISWESLEPSLHLDKIKKKKIVKLYRLAEGKSLPNIGLWDPVLEFPFKSCDFKSLSSMIERQQFQKRTFVS